MRSLKTLLFLLLSLVFASARPQGGIIRGQVIDDSTGEPMPGASVVIQGTTRGSVTDMDGRFEIGGVAPGSVALQVSFVSFLSTTIQDVVVRDGEITVVNNIRLKEEAIGLEEVVVVASALGNYESSLLTMQRKSSIVFDGISADMVSRNNDNDAAAAIRRVTGVSVEGGRYVIVRGLGDRYSKASLNRAELPSLDPNKNAVQMDLFPSNLLNNMVIYKTFSPELPGSFSGGFVDISTKEFPDRFTLQASASLGYNTNVTFNKDFLTTVKGKTAFLGMDDGTYALPAEAQNGIPPPTFNAAQDVRLDIISKSFTNSYDPLVEKMSPMMNQNLSFSMGDQKKLFGREFGFIVGLTYQHNFEYYDDGRVGRFFLPGVAQGQDLVVVRDFTQDMKGTESVLWGALANLSYRINPSHKLSLNLVRNQSSDLSSRFLQGVFPADANLETDELQVRSIRYIERALASVQLKGDHKLTGGGLSMNWSASGTSLRQEEPDQRFFNNVISVDSATEQATYYTFQNATGDPARYYRTLDEKNFDGKLNVEIPLSSVSQDSKVKLGGAYLFKDRNFLERIISNKQQAADNYEGIVDEYFSQGNVGLITSNPYRLGIYSVETQNLGGSYNGQERIPAAYAMADLKVSRRFRVSAGARYEGTDIALYATSPYLPDSLRSSTVKRNDILPAANLTWEIGDNMNLRVAYGNTIARPTFRELSQYTSFDFLGDSRETGNPNLRRTSIQNTDIRWEVFPSNKEYISVSAFYKDFTDPIERVTSPYNNEPKDGISFYYNNVDRARLYGAEFEVRKSLGFISSQLADFRLGANVTLMKSQVDISPIELEQIRVNNPEAEAQRALAGQSPYIVNANLGYSSAETGWDVTLIYNVIGPRLFAVSTNGTPNIYEQPRNALDMTVRKSLGSRSTLRLSMQNLLDAPYRFTQEFAGKEYIYQSYSVGTTFSLGFSYLIE